MKKLLILGALLTIGAGDVFAQNNGTIVFRGNVQKAAAIRWWSFTPINTEAGNNVPPASNGVLAFDLNVDDVAAGNNLNSYAGGSVDVVLRSKLKIIEPGKELKARFTSITSPLKGEVEDVVRMPHLEGFWHLVQINEKLTKVTYQVNADPAGMLPDWLVVMTSRDIPLHTLKGLRDQVAKTKGEYTDFVSRWKAKG